ncbi:unnamed protein product [Pedinophyceae sp. YPF-701]|nr:unnamed protein product [Pedinophyceae sp. YPF-701]
MIYKPASKPRQREAPHTPELSLTGLSLNATGGQSGHHLSQTISAPPAHDFTVAAGAGRFPGRLRPPAHTLHRPEPPPPLDARSLRIQGILKSVVGANNDGAAAELSDVLSEVSPAIWGHSRRPTEASFQRTSRNNSRTDSLVPSEAGDRGDPSRTPSSTRGGWTPSSRTSSRLRPPSLPWLTGLDSLSLAQRWVAAGRVSPIGKGAVAWAEATGVVASEMLAETPAAGGDSQSAEAGMNGAGGILLDINSGGRVFFVTLGRPQHVAGNAGGGGTEQMCANGFSPRRGRSPAPGEVRPGEGPPCVVLKFCASRLEAQSEQFGAELAAHVGLKAPACRIVRRSGKPGSEWAAIQASLRDLEPCGAELNEEMTFGQCALVMEYVPGSGLFEAPAAFAPATLATTCEDLGRLLLLDMVLGNSDRLPMEAALGWRGNPNNVLFATDGPAKGRLVAIDQSVPRRPPGALREAEDLAAHRLAELLLNDDFVASQTLGSLLALAPRVLDGDAAKDARSGPTASPEATRAFQHGLRDAINRASKVQGLLDMMYEHLSGFIRDFIADMEGGSDGILSPKAAGAGARWSAQEDGSPSGAGATASPRDATPTDAERGVPDPHRIRWMTSSEVSPGMGVPSGGHGCGLHRRSASQVAPLEEDALISSLASPKGSRHKSGNKLSRKSPLRTSLTGGDDGGSTIKDTPMSEPPSAQSDDARAASSATQDSQAAAPASTAATASNDNAAAAKHEEQPAAPPGAAPSPLRAAGQGGRYLGGSGEATVALKRIKVDAKRDEELSTKLQSWVVAIRERCSELRAAVVAWQNKRSRDPSIPLLTTGFLDGTFPVVDTYELKVRLQHVLQRLRLITEANATATPVRILPGLFLGSAVCANSHHVLRHLGITHVLNATEPDEVQPPPEEDFVFLRVPVRDAETVKIREHFRAAADFIDAGLPSDRGPGGGDAAEDGRPATPPRGGVLVHCYEGKSRSVTLLLAFLMERRGMSLKGALEHVQAAKPDVRPNSGFMKQLVGLEEAIYGKASMSVKGSKKPTMKACPLCGEAVGISDASVKVHIKRAHPGHTP